MLRSFSSKSRIRSSFAASRFTLARLLDCPCWLARYGWGMAIFDVPKRFSRQWVQRKVPQMDSTEFHAMFHEAATRGWDEDELRQLARMWADESGFAELKGASR